MLLWKPRIFHPPGSVGYIGNVCTEPLGPWMVKAAMTCGSGSQFGVLLPTPTSWSHKWAWKQGHSIASAVSSPAMSESSSDGSFSSRWLIEKDFLMASFSPRGEKDVLGYHLTR